ncbi:Hypothetical protein PHPALM_11445 [Phytophthora palmivora]|uniref:ZSWIM1/3 RNaseH-like domain-containing protein n=1 Tax=Phytophthora palmivora TaxID=4796 RepID=A0A2P4Y291_9STRA|nr:Hypothetical protein PHPALM_11445 [Phytophthora palmivora]
MTARGKKQEARAAKATTTAKGGKKQKAPAAEATTTAEGGKKQEAPTAKATTKDKNQKAPALVSTRATLRAYKPVDYLRAGQGFTKENSDDDDYVDSPSSAMEDIALEDEDFTNLVDEDPHVLEEDSVARVPAKTEDVAKGSTEGTENDLVEVMAIEHAAAAKHPDAVYSPKISNGEPSVETTVEVTTKASGIRSNKSAEETKGEDAIEMGHTSDNDDNSNKRRRPPQDDFNTDHESSEPPSKRPNASATSAKLFTRPHRLARRHTKNAEIHDQMLKDHKSVNNQKPGLPQTMFDSWDEFQQVLDAYEAENYVHYRVRISEKRDKYNRLHVELGAETLILDLPGVKQASPLDLSKLLKMEQQHFATQHKTTKAIYESYSGPKSSTLSRNVRQDLGLLTEMKTSTANINRYLADKINIAITPQQTRNLLRHLLGSTTLERISTTHGRTKALLDTFADEEGNHVLFVQDQMDITCIIAMQTAVQNPCVQQWGDTLVMDWTHGTNNLGYHLGCPVLLRMLLCMLLTTSLVMLLVVLLFV